jgi:putative membrane protein
VTLHPPPDLDLDAVAAGWTPDPLVGVGLVVLAFGYARGARRLWAHAGAGHGLAPRHVAAYGLGLAAAAVALVSPLDRASDVLFSAHMIQHELLMLVAAPLLVLGRPLVPLLWALPRSTRVGVRRIAARPRWRAAGRLATAPLFALALHAAVRWLWHLPAAFDAALAHEGVHHVQHLTFLGSAALFWWTVLQGRFGRAGYGVGIAFVFMTMLHSGVLAAMLSLSSSPWYGPHAARTMAWDLDPLADQRRAGLYMWVPAGTVMTATALALLAAWLGDARRRIARSPHPGLRSPDPPD